jgi:hypothetical protein
MAAESPESRAERPTYTSPQRKLVAFFAQSRDQWKAKCRGAKAHLKQLTAICERMRPNSHNAETSAECRTG